MTGRQPAIERNYVCTYMPTTNLSETLTGGRSHADEVPVVADAALPVRQQAGAAVLEQRQRVLTLALLQTVEHIADEPTAAVAHAELGAVPLLPVLVARLLQTVVLAETNSTAEQARVAI